MKKLILFFVISLFNIILIQPAKAFEVKIDNSINLAAEEIADGNVYANCSEMKIDGTVNGDIIALCKNIIINGVINGDFIAFAQNITVNGEIKGNLRIAGTNLIINGSIGHNVNVFGSEINFTPNSKVSWDVLVSGVNGQFNGLINGNLHGNLASTLIAGKVEKNVNLKIDNNPNSNLLIDKEAIIGGNLNYQANSEAIIESPSSVLGSTTKQTIELGTKNVFNQLLNLFYRLSALILLGLVIISFKKKPFYKVAEILETKNWQANLIGLAYLFLMPLIIIFLSFTIIGLPLALLLFCFYLILIFLSTLFSSFWLGKILLSLIFKKELNPFIVLSSGLALVTLFSIIPYIGWILVLMLIIGGLGSTLLTIKNSFYD